MCTGAIRPSTFYAHPFNPHQQNKHVIQPLKLGEITLPNRILLAPLTRTRADAGHMPNALMAEYYSQRATGGLLITECTMVAPGTSAFINEPGIYSEAQIAAWKMVTGPCTPRVGAFSCRSGTPVAPRT